MIHAYQPAQLAPRLPEKSVLFWDGDLPNVKGIFPSDPATTDLDPCWRSGNEVNASTTIEDGEIEASVWDFAHTGNNIGARAFATRSGIWSLTNGLLGQRSRIAWIQAMNTFIPIQQGAGNFLTFGVEGKMIAQDGSSLGIWATNVEMNSAGQLVHWVQNQSGIATVYHAKMSPDAIPISTYYECVLDVLWDNAGKGSMSFYYLNTRIDVPNVSTMAKDQHLGLAFCLYAGQNAAAIPTNRRLIGRFAQPRLWTLPAAA